MKHARSLLFCLLFALSWTALATPVDASRQPHVVAGLGSIDFPTSTRSQAAQAAFDRGTLLLHLFEYANAAAAFREAQRLDPGYAMAYWGEAMSYNHGIWNQLDETAGRAALARLAATPADRAAKAPTARERAYLAAVEILYSGKGSKVQRDADYSAAMQKLAVDFPQDNNAQLFHALALMGLSEGVRDIPVYLRAAAIAERSYRVNPDNPGAAHYWIHGMDEPVHAAGALEAARALSKIAPDAGHAQHMTSHIFIALGMWDDLVTANENAMRVVLAQQRAQGKPAVACGHYQYWLAYGYYQQGRRHAGDQATQACVDSAASALAWHAAQAKTDASSSEHAHGADMAATAVRMHAMLVDQRATSVIESEDWNGPAAHMAIDTSDLGAKAAWNQFVDGYIAVKRGDLASAHAALAGLASTRREALPDPTFLQQAGYLAVLEDDLRGLVEISDGNTADGLRSIRQAADRYDAMAADFGPPVPIKPPHELLGEQLLAQGQAAAAAREFTVALQRAPGRALSLLGLARAQAASGKAEEARASYRKLLDNFHAADADLPALAEARAYLSH